MAGNDGMDRDEIRRLANQDIAAVMQDEDVPPGVDPASYAAALALVELAEQAQETAFESEVRAIDARRVKFRALREVKDAEAEVSDEQDRGRQRERGEPGERDRSRSRGEEHEQRRRSGRIEITRRAAEAAAEVARQAREAADRAAAEAKRRADEADAALRRAIPGYTPIKGVIKKIPNRDRAYLNASRMFLPIFFKGIGDDRDDTTGALITFPDLFKLGLKEVCTIIYGEILTRRLEAQFSAKRSIRQFFEVTDPQDQCAAILEAFGARHPINLYCWICGTLLQQPPCAPGCQQDCEHRADLLLAMMTTGLYDQYLHMILVKSGRSAEYKDLLKFEYAYAHPVCNRLKTDDHFITGRVLGDGTVEFQANAANIRATLTNIFEKDTRITGPQPSTIADQFNQPTWDGNVRTDQLTTFTGDRKAYLTTRVGVIQASLKELVDKLNKQKLSAKALCLRITRGFLYRAIEIAPELTKEALWDSLEKPYQDALERRQAGMGRRRTPRRNRTRKQLRGGVQISFDDAFDATVEYIVYCESLLKLKKDLDAYTETTSVLNAMDVLDRAMDAHSQRAYARLQAIDWNALHAKVAPLKGKDVVQAILEELGLSNAAPAAMADEGAPLTVDTATPARATQASTPARSEQLSTVQGDRTPSGQSDSEAPVFASPVSVRRASSVQAELAAAAPASGPAPSQETVLGSMGPGVASLPQGEDNSQRRGGFTFTLGKRPDWL